MTEIYLHPKETRKLLMMPEQDVIVGRESAQFSVSLLDSQECLMYVFYGDLKDQFQKCSPYLAINNRKQDSLPLAPRDNEVCFGIADPHPLVDGYGSFFDEGSLGQLLCSYPTSSPSGFFLGAVIFNSSPVHAANVAVNTLFTCMRETMLMRFNSSGNILRRLIAVEFPLHETPKIGMLHDLHCLILAVVSGNVCLVLCFLGIVGLFDFVVRHLVPDP